MNFDLTPGSFRVKFEKVAITNWFNFLDPISADSQCIVTGC